jgi:dTDP-4-amino-4,6-dideoxygalactose transaminase
MILFNDFKAHCASVRTEVDEAVARVLDSGWFVLGPEVDAFESEFAAWTGSAHAVGVGSGTAAIALALMAFDIGPGDEVITANLTAYPTITGIKQCGATPRVADIDPRTGLICVESIRQQITAQTRAIVPVHLYGQSCDMVAIKALADEHDLVIIEDCAQSTGATFGDRQTGTMGDAGCFSFYPTKNLGAFGDGGAVTTQSAEIADKLKALRNYGQTTRYYHDGPGLNSRLDEMQAAILRAKLPMLQSWNQSRRRIATIYRESMSNVEPMVEHDYGRAVYHLFVVGVDGDRDEFIGFMKDGGVQTLVHYPVPIIKQKDFSGQETADFPASSGFAESIVSLPIHPHLSDDAVRTVIERVKDWNG